SAFRFQKPLPTWAAAFLLGKITLTFATSCPAPLAFGGGPCYTGKKGLPDTNCLPSGGPAQGGAGKCETQRRNWRFCWPPRRYWPAVRGGGGTPPRRPLRPRRRTLPHPPPPRP